MEKSASEPRALSMSLDEIIQENREKEGRNHRSNGRHTRGGAHFVPHKSGGKQFNNNYNKGNRQAQPQSRSVRARYVWETVDGVERMSLQVEGKELLVVSSTGDVVIRSGVEHDWAVFTPMNTVLATVQLKLYFDGDIKKEWTVKNEAGWNRILDNDV